MHSYQPYVTHHTNTILSTLTIHTQLTFVMRLTCATLKEEGGLGNNVSCDVKPESWLDTDMYRMVPVRPTGCSQDNTNEINN